MAVPKLQKEMSIINRNHIAQQQLNNYMGELHSEQVRALEKCKNEQKLMWEDLRKLRTSSGTSKCGERCDERLDKHIKLRHLSNKNWKLTMSDSEIPVSPPAPPNQPRPWTTDNTYKPPRPPSQSGLMRTRPETQHAYRSSHVSFEETVLLKDSSEPLPIENHESHNSLLSQIASEQTENNSVFGDDPEKITKISDQNLEERRVVRNNTIRQFSKSLPKLENCKISGYIRPEQRHRYDLLTIKRLIFLKKSIPATHGTTETKPLTSTFSVNSRKAALESLVNLNNQLMDKTYHGERNEALEERVRQFLRTTL